MTDSSPSDPKREMLRHALATIAYRGGKALRNAPVDFATFQAGGEVRTPERILAHMSDLMDWALSIALGKEKWHNSKPLAWEHEVARFFAALTRFDDFLASSQALDTAPEKLLQGPIADALTHIGQLATLRRIAGAQIKSENYFEAEITLGRVGSEQNQPKREF